MPVLLPRRTVAVLFGAASATLCLTGNVFAQFETLAVPPLNGFQPLVIFGLTDEQAEGDLFDGSSHTSTTPGNNGAVGNSNGPPQQYFVGVLDTGAQASIVQANVGSIVTGMARDGTHTQIIVGASGAEHPTVTDALGLYFTGFNNGTTSGGSLTATSGSLSGMWNTSVLQAEPGSALPNIVGAPVVGLYQVAIQNSMPYHLTTGGTTYRSPKVSFSPINTPISETYGRVEMQVTNNVGGPPTYIPDFNGIFDDPPNLGNNPMGPSVWESLFIDVSLSHTGGSKTASFLFDTGAEVSVLSSTTAASLGIFTTGSHPTPPDFFIDVAGVGGDTSKVKGYYINQLALTSTSGVISYQRAAVIVLNIPDPRNPNQTLPGVIGTNLFTGRDLIINVDSQAMGMTGLYVSDLWQWNGTAGGSWGDSTKWDLVLPSGIDTQANFFTPFGATVPQTVTVPAGGFTVGSVAFDNANSYTLNGPGRITLDVSTAHAEINVNSGTHTIAAPMTFLDDTDISVNQATAKLTITTDVLATGVAINKEGPGTLEMKNVRAGSLNINGGTLRILPSATMASAASRVTSLGFGTLNAATEKLDLGVAPMAIDYTGPTPASSIRGFLRSGYANGAWTGPGITSSGAATVAATVSNLHKTAIGFAEASAIGNPSTWFGQNVDGTSLLLRYTFTGDANLDGTINGTDFTTMSQAFNGLNKGWWQGDFNFDGVVNALDFNALASNWGQVMPADALGALVPEPTTISAILLATLLARKRTRATRSPAL